MKYNEKSFNSNISNIKKTSEGLAQSIHEAGLFAIEQVNEHGNIGFASRLIEAMGKKHDAQRVVNWLVRFGKIGVKSGTIVFRKRKDITAETMDAWYAKAESTPYWELTPQKSLVERIDYLAAIKSLLGKHERALMKIESGETVEEFNTAILPEIGGILAKYSKPVAPANNTKAAITA